MDVFLNNVRRFLIVFFYFPNFITAETTTIINFVLGTDYRGGVMHRGQTST